MSQVLQQFNLAYLAHTDSVTATRLVFIVFILHLIHSNLTPVFVSRDVALYCAHLLLIAVAEIVSV